MFQIDRYIKQIKTILATEYKSYFINVTKHKLWPNGMGF